VFLPSHLQVKTEESYEKNRTRKFKEARRNKPGNHTFRKLIVDTSYYEIKPKSRTEWKQK